MLMQLRLILVPAILAILIGGARCYELAPADINAYPWSAIGKLYNRAGGSCTAAVISPLEVATAAHCLFNPRTRLLLHPESLHFLIGYKQGDYRHDLRVADFTTGPNYTLNANLASEVNDWAILRLADRVPEEITPIPRANSPPKIGDRIMVGGFAQTRQYSLTADTNCGIRGILSTGLILHDCAVLKGDSGAPIMRRAGERIEVVGIHVAAGISAGTAIQIAVPVSSLTAAN